MYPAKLEKVGISLPSYSSTLVVRINQVADSEPATSHISALW